MAKPLPAQAAETKWRDLREWLARVDSLGELKRVTGANSEEDIGAITEMLDHTEGSPCVLFDEIPNFKPGPSQHHGVDQAASRDLGTRSRKSLSRTAVTILARAFERIYTDSAGGRQTRTRSGKYSARWRCRLDSIPGADLAPRRWWSVHRHGELQYHARSRHRQHQRWHVSQSGIRQERYRHPCRAAAPRRYHQGKIYAARTALPPDHRRRHRSSAVFGCLRRGSDLWAE